MNSFFEEIGFTYNIETDEWERYTIDGKLLLWESLVIVQYVYFLKT